MTKPLQDPTGAKIVATLESAFGKYVALDEGLPFVLALWTLATHVFECFDAFPYLAITSPTKRSGKTRLAEIIELLAANTQRTVGITPAALYRSIQDKPLTLIIDEAEALRTRSDRAEALREILNAGYRLGQYVTRCERGPEGNFELRHFNTYCPKVLVLIGNLPETLADRCIPIQMRRIGPAHILQRFRYFRVRREVRVVLGQIPEWVKPSKNRVKRYYYAHGLGFLKDREEELWLPLFSVCAIAAPDRLKALENVAMQLAAHKESCESDEHGITLLKDIRDLFDREGTDRLTTSSLVPFLLAIEESPWATWSRGRGLDARGLARLLRPFRISPQNLRLGADVVKGYLSDDFREAWANYVPGASATPPQPA
jgi:hypothetical protein